MTIYVILACYIGFKSSLTVAALNIDKEDIMNVFKLKDTEIHSLAELRENFALELVIAAFLDGTLEQWLVDCYYEKEAKAVADLKRTLSSAIARKPCTILGVDFIREGDLAPEQQQKAEAVTDLEHALSPAMERKLCAILGVDYIKEGYLTPKQQLIYERKCAAIRQFSDDPTLLAHAMETATNQVELAELLNAGYQNIYLCGGSFTVPIRKSGIHYSGIGNPHMEAPFTEEQYHRAGITFENITLPQVIDKETASIAKVAAAKYGYDDFAEEHNHLASIFHTAIKGRRLFIHCPLSADTDPAGEFYKTKSSAERAARNSIEQAYDQANRYFQPGQGQCIAPPLAKDYAAFIRKGAEGLVDALRHAGKDKQVKELERLISNAESALLERFEQELRNSADYYEMYKKSYFLERIEIEKCDYNLDLFDSDLLNGLARLIHDDSEYTVENLHEIVMELDNDLKKHADTFFGEAYRIFQDYCREIEDIAEEIGGDLSDDMLQKLGILKERSQVS